MTAIFCGLETTAQIKIGNNPTVMDTNAILEMETTNKGMLLPRIALTATTNQYPLGQFVAGMFIFNTATINDVSPGVYYSDGTKWIKVNASTAGWDLNGNSGTDSTNFIGTRDDAALIMKTNNAEQMRITQDGRVGIGTSNPNATLHVQGDIAIDSIADGDPMSSNILVADATTGQVKKVPTQEFVMTADRTIEVVQSNGQNVFDTPGEITDPNKILLFRNGMLISFTVVDSNTIMAELPCVEGDEIKIIQLK